LTKQFEDFSFGDSFVDEISECAIGTEFYEDVNAVFDFFEAVEAHDVGMNEGGEGHQSLHFSFVSLSLHGLNGYQTILFGRVPSEDLSETAFAQYAIRV
jgi:hypothetical protein